MFNINNFRNIESNNGRYKKRIQQLRNRGIKTDSIEKTVSDSTEKIQEGTSRFVIYGEPQSGKTEMMIALTAKLLDIGHRIIVVLLNDNVQLLNQNLSRFKNSGLDPAPRNFSDILDHAVSIHNKKCVIFAKKNTRDLEKLTNKLSSHQPITIIDDEADYASPNSLVNKDKKTKINSQIDDLIGDHGFYIGVTATPARLDLNNTFDNDVTKWVNFPVHNYYAGQDIFFPISHKNPLEFILTPLPDAGDDPKYLREAFFNFLVTVAYLNTKINKNEKNYSFLVHTSGKKDAHAEDYKNLTKIIHDLTDRTSNKWKKYIEAIYDIAKTKFPNFNTDSIVTYIIRNISRNDPVVMNSDADKKHKDPKNATTPATLFTIIIGGNIISRGVTFENLLSMFFTRDVRHKMQQDTYIQRARMFGNRNKQELKHFELTIPEHLYDDWYRCFLFHRLALDTIKNGNEAPVWLGDKRVNPVATPSIDRSTIQVDRGEMSYAMFDFNSNIINNIINAENIENLDKLYKLQEEIGENSFPKYTLQFLENFLPIGNQSIKIHGTVTIMKQKDSDHINIARSRGMFSGHDTKDSPALHHFRIYYNDKNKARLFYKYTGSIIRYLKNTKYN